MTQSKSIRDAFLSLAQNNTTAKSMIIEAKVSIKATRIRALKDLVFETFCGDLLPVGQRRRSDIYHQAKDEIRRLGAIGGREYDKAMAAVKMTWVDKASYLDAIAVLLPR